VADDGRTGMISRKTEMKIPRRARDLIGMEPCGLGGERLRQEGAPMRGAIDAVSKTPTHGGTLHALPPFSKTVFSKPGHRLLSHAPARFSSEFLADLPSLTGFGFASASANPGRLTLLRLRLRRRR
jgi:hypothetical protein